MGRKMYYCRHKEDSRKRGCELRSNEEEQKYEAKWSKMIVKKRHGKGQSRQNRKIHRRSEEKRKLRERKKLGWSR